MSFSEIPKTFNNCYNCYNGADQTSTLNINDLPDELILQIFEFLSINDLNRTNQVSKGWKKIESDYQLINKSVTKFLHNINCYKDDYGFDISKLKKMLQVFKSYKLDKGKQAIYGDHDITKTIFFDSNIAKINRLNHTEIHLFLAYLVITDKIFGFSTMPSSINTLYRLDFVDPSAKKLELKTLYTKELLTNLSEYMQKLHIPEIKELSQLAPDSIGFMTRVLYFIRFHHQKRFLNEANNNNVANKAVEIVAACTKEPCTGLLRIKASEELDLLVKNGTISAWNVNLCNQMLHLKLAESDQVKSAMHFGKKWRDRKLIEEEEGFKMKHQINISDFDKKELDIILNESQKKQLEFLLSKLNGRTRPGFFIWYAQTDDIILALLKDKGYIHDYESSLSKGIVYYVIEPDINPNEETNYFLMEQEEKFRTKNHIELNEKDHNALESILDHKQKVKLKHLLNQLNKRVNHGVYIWNVDENALSDHLILRELKDRGYIDCYYYDPSCLGLCIYVKREDVEAEALKYENDNELLEKNHLLAAQFLKKI